MSEDSENKPEKALLVYDFPDRIDQYLSKEDLARKYPQWAEEILKNHPFWWSKSADSESLVPISPHTETKDFFNPHPDAYIVSNDRSQPNSQGGKMKTVRDFQEFFKDKNPNLPVYLWRGENVVMCEVESLDHAPADPEGLNNEDSFPTPEMILIVEDNKKWFGREAK